MNAPPAFRTIEGPVHFMGVAGAGMVSLAELFVRSGVSVTGCDLAPGSGRPGPFSLGCASSYRPRSGPRGRCLGPGGHRRRSRRPPRDPKARELGIPVLKRAEALGSG